MKQNGFRLVQRKFAQGVPVPASAASVAPPPERKPEPYPCQRSVYHNNMSARNLLDIVAMQNIHKHKQPMVVLERLREDEIPSAPPKLRVPMRKRRAGLRVKNNNMCLRSGKRKSPDVGKGPAKKRKKVSSVSTDDIPLVYYLSSPNKAQSPAKTKGNTEKKERDKRTPATRAEKLVQLVRRGADRSVRTRLSSADRSDDGSTFTFKEPSSPVRNLNRVFKRKPAANTVIAGRQQRKASLPKPDSRRSGLRSASATLRIGFRPRDKRHSAKKTATATAAPVLRKSMPRPLIVKDETLPVISPIPQIVISRRDVPQTDLTWTPLATSSVCGSSANDSADTMRLRYGSRESTPMPMLGLGRMDPVTTSPSLSPLPCFHLREGGACGKCQTNVDGAMDWCIDPKGKSEPTESPVSYKLDIKEEIIDPRNHRERQDLALEQPAIKRSQETSSVSSQEGTSRQERASKNSQENASRSTQDTSGRSSQEKSSRRSQDTTRRSSITSSQEKARKIYPEKPCTSSEVNASTRSLEKTNTRSLEKTSKTSQEKPSTSSQENAGTNTPENAGTKTQEKASTSSLEKTSKTSQEKAITSSQENAGTNTPENAGTRTQEKASTSSLEKTSKTSQEKASTSSQENAGTNTPENAGTRTQEKASTTSQENASPRFEENDSTRTREIASSGTQENAFGSSQEKSINSQETAATSSQQSASTSTQEKVTTSSQESSSTVTQEITSTSTQEIPSRSTQDTASTSCQEKPSEDTAAILESYKRRNAERMFFSIIASKLLAMERTQQSRVNNAPVVNPARTEPAQIESNGENSSKESNQEQSLMDMKNEKERKLAQKRAERRNTLKDKAKEAATRNGPQEKKTKKAPVRKGAKAGVKPTSQPDSVIPPRLLRTTRDSALPTAPANLDVYDFNAELETSSRPPSGLRSRRPPPRHSQPSQPTNTEPTPSTSYAEPAPSTSYVDSTDAQDDQESTSPSSTQIDVDKEVFIDVFPGSELCIHVTPCVRGANYLNVKIVKKQLCYMRNKQLVESNPELLERFLSCLSTEIHLELDSLLANESSASADERPSSSQAVGSTVKVEAEGASTSNYLDQKTGSVLEAPTFHPTAEEFADPIKYYEKIAPQASAYGLCKIVPPEGFKPPCNMSEAIRFAVIYQYISKMYNRWGPVSRELAAIKAHLRTQSVVFARSPLLDGSEVNLPKLYYAVERNGGLSKVIQRKRWGRVAEEMKLTKLQHPERKLDPIYMRYLLPYATLSDQERQKIMAEVESGWTSKYQKMLDRARNPFQRQNRMLGTEPESESDDDGEDGNIAGALKEAEDCIVQGRIMNLATFKKIATSLMDAHFAPSKQPPSAADVEKAYWRAVLLGTEHIVANTASIDTGEEGYGFPKDHDVQYGQHPWNLKVLARNRNNVLRYLGAALGVTVPTLHLGMLFSTSCWHRDPHGLPWVEYMHTGAEKIWYGIPRGESANFRRAVETLCPAYCQNKSIWLASEITMIPPNILTEHGVKLSRVVQQPGEYVLVFPEAHSCSITTGYAISESVYFASNKWLDSVYKLFQELRNSCEPTMFSLEQLLLNGSEEEEVPQHVTAVLVTLLNAELDHRRALEAKGLKVQELPAVDAAPNTSYFRAWNARDQDECQYCRSTLYLSKVIGLTGRKSALCPEHAISMLEARKYRNFDLTTLEFVSSHSTAALEDMMERLDARSSSEAEDPEREVIDLTGPEPAQ